MLHKRLDEAVGRLEQAKVLDGAAAAVQSAARPLVRGRIGEVLRGEPIGHPLHPALVAVPIGAWLSASALDLTGGDAVAARRLVALGCLVALPTAASGAADWLRTTGPERRVGFVHAGLNDVALGIYVASWRSRAGGRRAKGAALALAGSGLLVVSGWLGGHLAYRRGVGVSPSAT
jgi:uncharacterized membrane protein